MIFDIISPKCFEVRVTVKFPEATPYTPPEVIKEPDVKASEGEDAEADEKAIDVYSVCSVLYEMGLGRPAIDPSVPTSKLLKLIAGGTRERVRRGVLAAGVEAAVLSGLAVDRSKRGTLSELIRACEEAPWNLFTGADRLKITQMVEALPVGAGVSHAELGLKVGHLQQLLGETEVTC